MTISADIDLAIEAASSAGVSGDDMILRMGRASRAALAADLGHSECGATYVGIPIEEVATPINREAQSDRAFHGWQLVTCP